MREKEGDRERKDEGKRVIQRRSGREKGRKIKDEGERDRQRKGETKREKEREKGGRPLAYACTCVKRGKGETEKKREWREGEKMMEKGETEGGSGRNGDRERKKKRERKKGRNKGRDKEGREGEREKERDGGERVRERGRLRERMREKGGERGRKNDGERGKAKEEKRERRGERGRKRETKEKGAEMRRKRRPRGKGSDRLPLHVPARGETGEIRMSAALNELETAVAVENLELKEQQSDRKELEETLEKLEKHKEKLIQQIKVTRQLCYEESQQEENALCSLSGSAVTPQSQMEGSSSPGDTTEDEPIPVRPWGRSQSLPAYADLIMVTACVRCPPCSPRLHSDPFKGSDPFGADVLFPDGSHPAEPGQDPGPEPGLDEADRSLSCAENKASTGTQCFESEFPDEDSDIEISYSREDLETAGQTEEEQAGFRPIQSSSEELGPVPIRGWKCQYSGESDPNGYELDLGNISPPSDIEELSLGSVSGLGDETLGTATAPAPVTSQPQRSGSEAGLKSGAHSPVTPAKDSQDYFHQSELKELSFDMNYEPSSLQSCYDPYGFKLSPEHSSHTLLDPDEEAPSPSTSEPDLAYDPEPLTSPPASTRSPPTPATRTASSSAPRRSTRRSCRFDFSNQEAAQPSGFEDELLVDYENQEVLEPVNLNNVKDETNTEALNQELFDFAPENQEVLDVFYNSEHVVVEYENQEVLEPCSPAPPDPRFDDTNQEVPDSEQHESREKLIDFSDVENQEVVSSSHHDNHMFHNQEVPDTDPDGNQEVLCKEANNNNQMSNSNSSDSDAEQVGVHRGVLGLAQEGGHRGALLEGDLGQVFRQGGYVGCPDVADDLEPLQRRAAPPPEAVRPVRPVRPPRPSLRAKEKAQGIDLK
ncbi:hypothetical protein WMY93_001012 [Mugilogobius chulae]|uniref:Uncharacterized protein n=1 Tax=Mugilogobius chulae TaxID=88201 RepID=A0AAW0Q6S8_9GOBI